MQIVQEQNDLDDKLEMHDNQYLDTKKQTKESEELTIQHLSKSSIEKNKLRNKEPLEKEELIPDVSLKIKRQDDSTSKGIQFKQDLVSHNILTFNLPDKEEKSQAELGQF